jgi:hypothetical protein
MNSHNTRKAVRTTRSSQALRRKYFQLEALESRTLLSVTIAPSGKSATYIDVSGHRVTITFSKGTLTAGIFTTVAAGQGEQLELIDLSGGGFDGTNITMKIKTPPGQSGIGDVGYINSTGHDLGTVKIPGDLGRIDAGDGDLTTRAIKSLTVGSVGNRGLTTQEIGGSLVSNINGSMGNLTLEGNFKDATWNVLGAGASMGAIRFGGGFVGSGADDGGAIAVAGSIASIKVQGGITGGAGARSAFISASNIGAVRVAGNLHGGSGEQSAQIMSTGGNIASVSVGGAIIGGLGDNSAEIVANGTIGNVSVGGGVTGALGAFSAAIVALNGSLGNLTIGGAVSGGVGEGSGMIHAHTDIGAIKIHSNVAGGSGESSGRIEAETGKIASVSITGSLMGGNGNNSGQITAEGNIAKVAVGGSLDTGAVPTSGCLESGGTLKLVTIGGSLNGTEITANIISKLSIGASVTAGSVIGAATSIGTLTVKQGIGGTALNPVFISAGGAGGSGGLVSGKTDVAIKSISVKGDMSFTNILAGYQLDLTPIDRHAQIGTVSVSGDLTASNIVAGAENANSTNTNFGDANDALIPANSTLDTATPLSSIASIKVGGTVAGTDAGTSASDHFGFVAQSIGSLTIHGVKTTLDKAPDTDNIPLGATGDFNLHEI